MWSCTSDQWQWRFFDGSFSYFYWQGDLKALNLEPQEVQTVFRYLWKSSHIYHVWKSSVSYEPYSPAGSSSEKERSPETLHTPSPNCTSSRLKSIAKYYILLKEIHSLTAVKRNQIWGIFCKGYQETLTTVSGTSSSLEVQAVHFITLTFTFIIRQNFFTQSNLQLRNTNQDTLS